MSDRPTPETDAKSRSIYNNDDLIAVGVVDSDFARRLERQRDAALEALEMAMEWVPVGAIMAMATIHRIAENTKHKP